MKPIAIFFASFALILSSIIGTGAIFLEKRIETPPNERVRMAHVRLLPKDIRSAVVRDYARRMPDHSDVVILGDSQTYGIDLPPSTSLGAYLRNAWRPHVYNMSIIDGRFSDQLNVIRILKEEGKRFKFLVINIDPAHFKKDLEDPHYLADANGYSLMFSLATTSAPGIYAPFLKIPKVDLPVVRNENTSVYTLDLYSQEHKPPVEFSEGRQPKDYYVGLDANKSKDLIKVLEAAASISDKVVAFAAPTSYDIYNEEKYKWNWDTRPVIHSALAHCRSIERTICVDLSSAIPHEHFIDVIHLRSDGQKMLADLLSNIMRRSTS